MDPLKFALLQGDEIGVMLPELLHPAGVVTSAIKPGATRQDRYFCADGKFSRCVLS